MSRRTAAEGGGAEGEDQEGAAGDDDGVADEVAGDVGVFEDLVHAVDGVGHREDVGECLQGRLHGVARGEQAAEQELGHQDGGHELDGLEFGGGEGRDEQAEGGAEERVQDGDEQQQPGGAGDVEAEDPDGEGRGEGRLDDRQQAEGQGVAADQVGLAEGMASRRSRVPEVRSRRVAMEVTRNIVIIGKMPRSEAPMLLKVSGRASKT